MLPALGMAIGTGPSDRIGAKIFVVSATIRIVARLGDNNAMRLLIV